MLNVVPIIGVASDASDLEAVAELLSALPAEFGSALVIVQHLDAGRERSLAATIEMRANLSVVPIARDEVQLERNHVYLAPPGAPLAVAGGYVRVMPNGKASGLDHPGDILFTSLAQADLACAMGVVLSGIGSDGALGIRGIKQNGGITFAQYPGSARFCSMPISAIETGCVDFVLRPYEIARELSRPLDSSTDVPRPALVLDHHASGSVVLNGDDSRNDPSLGKRGVNSVVPRELTSGRQPSVCHRTEVCRNWNNLLSKDLAYE